MNRLSTEDRTRAEELAASWEQTAKLQEERVTQVQPQYRDGHLNAALAYKACAEQLRKIICTECDADPPEAYIDNVIHSARMRVPGA